MAKETSKGPHDVLNLYKRVSETPLQTIERYVSEHTEYKDTKMTYAGRLDPMAEGVLIVLSGEKNKERESYTGLDKEYEFEFVLGIDTDTHDVLGKIVSDKGFDISEEKLKAVFSKYTGKFKQKYPAYSSKVVDGIPLFSWAKRGKIGSILLPEHEVEVSDLKWLGVYTVTKEVFAKGIEASIKAVTGDFRQTEIRNSWKKYFEETTRESFTIHKAKVSCGSGFYVRQLVSDVGKDLGCGAVTTKILRTRVGQYHLKDSIK